MEDGEIDFENFENFLARVQECYQVVLRERERDIVNERHIDAAAVEAT